MKILQVLTLIAASSGLLALPAQAKDHDKDHDKDKKHKKHSHDEYQEHHPNFTYGSGVQHRPYYGPSSTVIVERERPVYYERQSYSSERPSYSNRSAEIDVQRGLARRGYYRGPIDGDIGPGSRASIRAFQSDSGYEPTGRIDRQLLGLLH